MEARTVIATRPRTRRTALGDTVTVRKSIHDSGLIEEQITLECPIELTETAWPSFEPYAPLVDVWAGRT